VIYLTELRTQQPSAVVATDEVTHSSVVNDDDDGPPAALTLQRRALADPLRHAANTADALRADADQINGRAADENAAPAGDGIPRLGRSLGRAAP